MYGPYSMVLNSTCEQISVRALFYTRGRQNAFQNEEMDQYEMGQYEINPYAQMGSQF